MWPMDLLDLVKNVQLRAETPVHAQNSVLYQCTDRHVIEAFAKFLPKSHCVAAAAFVKESIVSIDRLTFVVATEQIEIGWELELQGKQERDDLDGLLAAVDVISNEQVIVILTRVADVFERPQ